MCVMCVPVCVCVCVCMHACVCVRPTWSPLDSIDLIASGNSGLQRWCEVDCHRSKSFVSGALRQRMCASLYQRGFGHTVIDPPDLWMDRESDFAHKWVEM